VLSDSEIAAKATLKPITQVAEQLGLQEDEIELYGRYKAKVTMDALKRLESGPTGKYVVVTAITPTPLGEGKTTVTVGLGQALGKLGQRSLVAIRQPSLGPVFGVKGGAAGGGYAQVVPMTDLNLHLTGDFHAVTAAHNLLAAFLDNSIYHGNPLNIDLKSVSWRRVLDVNDRSLRDIVIGLGPENGVPRETGFDITAASEVMAILALATSYRDLRQRLGRIVVALNRDREPVTAEDVGAAGAMAALLSDALKPNLMQTLENTPVMVHAGPFGNIAHGNSSVLADLIGIRLADVLVTESGFGADLGAEKFFDIKCRVSGLRPDAAVLVCTVRALKSHSGRYKIVAGRPLDPALLEENLEALREGAPNLEKQIENVRQFGVPVVVSINRFPSDTPAEVDLVRQVALRAGALDAVETNVFAEGGAGGVDLARAVMHATKRPSAFKPLYEPDEPLKTKIERIAKRLYGAGTIVYLPAAERSIRQFTRLGFDQLPVCMAKTHLSLSADPSLKARPEGFELTVREVRLSAGAGFVYPLLGEMRTMPGLGSLPGGIRVDIDDEGVVHGLF
jgi:formate--tetrahydrofolate ligase